jgi:hypothetical protein
MEGDDRQRFCDACGRHVYEPRALPHEDLVALAWLCDGPGEDRFEERCDGTLVRAQSSGCRRRGPRRVLERVLLGAAAIAVALVFTAALGALSTTPAHAKRKGHVVPVARAPTLTRVTEEEGWLAEGASPDDVYLGPSAVPNPFDALYDDPPCRCQFGWSRRVRGTSASEVSLVWPWERDRIVDRIEDRSRKAAR